MALMVASLQKDASMLYQNCVLRACCGSPWAMLPESTPAAVFPSICLFQSLASRQYKKPKEEITMTELRTLFRKEGNLYQFPGISPSLLSRC